MHRIAAAGLATAVTAGSAWAATGTALATGTGHSGAAAPARSAVLTRGLDGPIGLGYGGRRSLVVAEADTGEVTRVSERTGAQRTVLRGLGSPNAASQRNGSLYVALGEQPMDEGASPPPARYRAATVLKARADGTHVRVLADLLAYERRHNPDGQVQFVKGKPVDTLSNPYALSVSRYGLLVADAGGNDVLRVGRRSGRVTTFFVPPTIKTVKACLAKGAQANPGTVGCDPVPTGLAVAQGSIYVSTLGAEVPGAARVYRLNPHNGRVQRVWRNLTGATGVAVGGDGSVFVSQVLYNAPEGDGPPPPGFDPSTVGRITRIAPNGTRTHAQVPMPTGLLWRHGRLYASTWSIARFLNLRHAGQVQRVSLRSFR